jgi:hypothetical protein
VFISANSPTSRTLPPYLGLALARLLDLCILCLVKLEAAATIAAAMPLHKAVLPLGGKGVSQGLQHTQHTSQRGRPVP